MPTPPFLTQLRRLNRDLDDVNKRRREAERRIMAAVRTYGKICLDNLDVAKDAETVRVLRADADRLSVEQKELRAKVMA